MIIAGAGGFARETLELILQTGEAGRVYFYDDVNPGLTTLLDGFKVLKDAASVTTVFKNDDRFCLGVGRVADRTKLYTLFSSLGGKCTTIISPHAILGKYNVKIGEGCTIASRAIVTTNVTIGKGCLININSTISHDSIIGDFCEISPGAHITGDCKIGNFCSIGTGAIVLPGISIGDNVVIGAGAVVTKNVADNSIVVGVPAQPLVKK